jgi:hypothetical protein
MARSTNASEGITMQRIVMLAVIGLGLGWASQAGADIPPPLPQGKESVRVKVEVDENAKGPRLVIPNGVFTAPRVRPRIQPKSEPKGALEPENMDGVADNDPQEQPRHHLLIAGLAMALSLGLGGMWLLRKNGKGTVGLMLLIAAGATLSIGAVVWANAAPPRPLNPAKNKIEAFPSAFDEKANVEFIYGQEPVRLILDKASFEKLKKGELTPPPAPAPR